MIWGQGKGREGNERISRRVRKHRYDYRRMRKLWKMSSRDGDYVGKGRARERGERYIKCRGGKECKGEGERE